jgi:hypothetical protein
VLVSVQYFDEARHVCALEVVGQVHVHVEAGHCVLVVAAAREDAHRVTDALDANAVDVQATGVWRTLNVGDLRHGRFGWLVHDDSWQPAVGACGGGRFVSKAAGGELSPFIGTELYRPPPFVVLPACGSNRA